MNATEMNDSDISPVRRWFSRDEFINAAIAWARQNRSKSDYGSEEHYRTQGLLIEFATDLWDGKIDKEQSK